ncbi:hypothetical protein EV426DRAFT_701198 [Tirmania nivea]|nr:hypothetical protein EV426DRAFT_701198 [Tirmania nivea]
MPLGGIFSRSRGEKARIHSRNLSVTEIEPPTTPRPNRARAKTLLSSPHTPLSKIFTTFGGRGGESWKKSITRPDGIDSFTRPTTSSSAFSSSSDSSFESMRTTATECTIPDMLGEDDDTDDENEKEKPKLGPAFSDELIPERSPTSILAGVERKRKHQERNSIGVRDDEWTDEMDGHLWRTYMDYQNDPTVTPFHLPPGGVPPLGVCHRVARVAKSTFKGLKSGVRARGPVTPVKGEPRPPIGNKADLMRKASLLKWPASESATRKRLRVLCKRGYGPSTNPYHNHRQDPTQFPSVNRLGTNHSSSRPLPPIADNADINNVVGNSVGNALLTSTRSMELSLAISASVSMRPDGAMAAISGGMPLPNLAELEASPQFHNHDPLPEFRGFTDANGNAPPVSVLLASVGLGHPVFARNTSTSGQSSHTPLYARRARANTTVELPVGMPSLQLGTSDPFHGSWPRRGARPVQESEVVEEFGGPSPRLTVPQRQPIEGLFDSAQFPSPPPPPPPPPPGPKTPPPGPRTRQRGYTINIGTSNGMNGKRRARPSEASTPLPPWNPEGVSDRPNLAYLLDAPPSSTELRRLGSPFVEDNSSKGKWRSTSDSEEFGPPLQKKNSAFLSGVVIGQELRREAKKSTDEYSGRPIKRVRE